jgi:hypothetical protein
MRGIGQNLILYLILGLMQKVYRGSRDRAQATSVSNWQVYDMRAMRRIQSWTQARRDARDILGCHKLR